MKENYTTIHQQAQVKITQGLLPSGGHYIKVDVNDEKVTFLNANDFAYWDLKTILDKCGIKYEIERKDYR